MYVTADDDYAIRFHSTGGPEVLAHEPITVPSPQPGEVRICHHAIGVNFVDTYYRSGLYDVPLPSGLGNESAGVVEAVGLGVTDLRVGERVATFSGPLGAYSTTRIVNREHVVNLPDGITFTDAAASLLKGCTAEFLIERCARVQPGQVVLVYAAAGGVGSILVQWLKAVGATVIAHAGDLAKAQLARELGADHALCCPMTEVAARVRGLTAGRGVEVVLDGVGAASWPASIEAVARRGLLVSYGNASGAVPPVSLLELRRAGSIFVTRPTLHDYCTDHAERQRAVEQLFGLMLAGTIKVRQGRSFPLAEAADAHRMLEARATTGSTLLRP
jgi:NADPH:quinone reductase